jgi:hypothetical protein
MCIALAPPLAAGQTTTCERFEAKAVLKSEQLIVSLDTDLPDSTQVMVGISRSHWADIPIREYPLDYLETRVTVGEWWQIEPGRHGADVESLR